MDKRIVDALIKFGLITNIDVDANQYKDVDELISKGIITVPGARETVQRIVDSFEDAENTIVDEDIVNPEPIIDEVPVTEPVIDETPVSEPIIDEVPVTEPVIDETPVEEATIVEVETVVEETANEPIVVEIPKKKRTTKKAETTAE
jgi:hypothetical protein